MALETTAILRELLYQSKIAETLEDVVDAVSVMCSDEDIAVVDKRVLSVQARRAAKAKKENQHD